MDVGDLVEDFELPDQSGSPRRLRELVTPGALVLFFYPAAMSWGCTAESCHFRDLVSEFAKVGAQVAGISHDPVPAQRAFAERYGFSFPLLSDPQRVVAGQFGVGRRFGPIAVRRWTFVVGSDLRVLHVVRSETRMAHHADAALAFLRSLVPPA